MTNLTKKQTKISGFVKSYLNIGKYMYYLVIGNYFGQAKQKRVCSIDTS